MTDPTVTPAAPNTTQGVHPKVFMATAGAAITILVVWIAGQFHLTIPPEVASAFTTVIGAVVGYSAGNPSS